MKSLWSDKFLKLSRTARKNQYKDKKKKRTYTKTERRIGVKRYNKQELLQWGKKRNIMVVRDLWKAAKIYEEAPTYRNILEQFGSWKNYTEALGITNKKFYQQKLDDRSYIQLCIRMGVTGKKKDYTQRYCKYKGILLSPQMVIKTYGNWTNFKRLIYSLNMDKVLQSYVLKSIQVGHILTLKQSDQYGIEIRRVMDSYSKKVFNLLLRQKQKQIYISIMKERGINEE